MNYDNVVGRVCPSDPLLDLRKESYGSLTFIVH